MGQFVGQFHFKKISPSPGRPKRAGTQYDGFHRFLVGQLVDLLEDLCAFPASDVGHVSERLALPAWLLSRGGACAILLDQAVPTPLASRPFGTTSTSRAPKSALRALGRGRGRLLRYRVGFGKSSPSFPVPPGIRWRARQLRIQL